MRGVHLRRVLAFHIGDVGLVAIDLVAHNAPSVKVCALFNRPESRRCEERGDNGLFYREPRMRKGIHLMDFMHVFSRTPHHAALSFVCDGSRTSSVDLSPHRSRLAISG